MLLDWFSHLPMNEIENIADQHALDPLLIAAIVQTETRGEPYALRYESDYMWLNEPQKWAKAINISVQTEIICQKISWGLMQVMGTSARDHGFALHLNKLSIIPLGLDFGCRVFSRYLKQYDENILDAIAAYNAGTASYARDGEYKNQEYVNRVMSFYRQGS